MELVRHWNIEILFCKYWTENIEQSRCSKNNQVFEKGQSKKKKKKSLCTWNKSRQSIDLPGPNWSNLLHKETDNYNRTRVCYVLNCSCPQLSLSLSLSHPVKNLKRWHPTRLCFEGKNQMGWQIEEVSLPSYSLNIFLSLKRYFMWQVYGGGSQGVPSTPTPHPKPKWMNLKPDFLMNFLPFCLIHVYSLLIPYIANTITL